MNPMIQTLERRMLMSVTAAQLDIDVQTVKQDAAAMASIPVDEASAFKSAASSVAADIAPVTTKTNRLSNHRLLAALSAGDAVWLARLNIARVSLAAMARVESTAAAAHGKLLLLHPTSTLFQNLVIKDEARLRADIRTRSARVEEAFSGALSAFLTTNNKIAAANGAVSAQVLLEYSNLIGPADTGVAPADQVHTDVFTLINDLGAI
jgi:hypothetical protein